MGDDGDPPAADAQHAPLYGSPAGRPPHPAGAPGPAGTIYTDPEARNPRLGGRPAEYDVKLHQRGEVPGRRSGILASMAYTVRTEGPGIGRGALAILRRGLS